MKVFVDLGVENVLDICRIHVDHPDCSDCARFDGRNERIDKVLVLEYLLWGSVNILADRDGAGKAGSSGELMAEEVKREGQRRIGRNGTT